MRVECPGVITTDAGGAPLCTDGASGVLAWTPIVEFDPADVDATTAGQAFTAGFVIVATGWAIGRGFKFVLSMLG